MALLDGNASSPLYQQLAEHIRDSIFKGIYKPDQQIPTEFELSDQYKVSRSTVRKAVEILVEEDMLTKIHGKGTFVAPPRVKQRSAGFFSSTKSMETIGKTLVSSVLETSLIAPSSMERKFFGITEENEKIIAIRRLRVLDDEPMCLETIYFSMRHLYLLQEDFSASMYRMLQTKYKIFPSSGNRSFEVCYATQEESELLGVERGSALMLIKDYVNDQNGVPLHISKRVHAGSGIMYGIAPMEFYQPKTQSE